MTTPTHFTAFPSIVVPARALAHGFVDESYGNDAAPFMRLVPPGNDFALTLMVGDEGTKAEVERQYDFWIERVDTDGSILMTGESHSLISGDDLDAVLAEVDRVMALVDVTRSYAENLAILGLRERPPIAIAAPVMAARMIEELVADMNTGVVPESVASFSELHDYIDANMLAYDFGVAYIGTDDVNILVDYLNPAQTIVDHYLAELRRQVAAKTNHTPDA